MSEYEMASLHVELFNSIQASIAVLLSVLSGFLVISYFAAHRLDRVSALVGLVVFAGYFSLNVAGTSGTLITYARLSHEIHNYAVSGRGLAWHHQARAPGWIVDTLSPALLVAGAIVLLASIRFFFLCRKINRLKPMSV